MGKTDSALSITCRRFCMKDRAIWPSSVGAMAAVVQGPEHAEFFFNLGRMKARGRVRLFLNNI
jgi:hypothetical protein